MHVKKPADRGETGEDGKRGIRRLVGEMSEPYCGASY